MDYIAFRINRAISPAGGACPDSSGQAPPAGDIAIAQVPANSDILSSEE